MKAILWTQYGPPEVLQTAEIDKPVPKYNEVLIRICASTATAGDCEMRSLNFPLFLRIPLRMYAGIRRPKRITILGQELAGEIESVGKEVSLFKVGDRVFGATDPSMGGYAEYKCLPEESKEALLAIKPDNMCCEEAATIPVGGLEALHFLSMANISAAQKVLINGAGGSIGTYAVQLAKNLQAEVTAVDSEEKLEMLRSLGADHVIDYTTEEFTSSGETYDVIFDVVGNSSYTRCMKSLTKRGVYLLANPKISKMLRAALSSLTSRKKVIFGTGRRKRTDLVFLKELIEAGKLKTVIDRRYPLEQVAEAHRYVETGKKKGNVIITI